MCCQPPIRTFSLTICQNHHQVTCMCRYIKTNHEVMVMPGLSRERPCFKSHSVESSQKLQRIVCRSGVVWALTDKCHWLVRAGVTPQNPQGTDWKSGDRWARLWLCFHFSYKVYYIWITKIIVNLEICFKTIYLIIVLQLFCWFVNGVSTNACA